MSIWVCLALVYYVEIFMIGIQLRSKSGRHYWDFSGGHLGNRFTLRVCGVFYLSEFYVEVCNWQLIVQRLLVWTFLLNRCLFREVSLAARFVRLTHGLRPLGIIQE